LRIAIWLHAVSVALQFSLQFEGEVGLLQEPAAKSARSNRAATTSLRLDTPAQWSARSLMSKPASFCQHPPTRKMVQATPELGRLSNHCDTVEPRICK